MKTLMLLLSFLIADLISFGQSSYSRYTDVVPAGGHTVTFHCCSNPQLCQVISVSTGGSAVNLRGNTYTLTYDSLPDKFQWDVYCNFSQLTLTNANQVTIFGVQPLVNWPAADTFVIHFVVLLNNGSKVLWYNYVSPQVSISGVVPGNTTFTGIVTLADSALYTNPPMVSGTPDRSKVLGVSSTSTAISRFCALLCTDSSEFWNIHGNLGTNSGINFVGTTDTVSLEFRVNNQASGKIEGRGNLSTAFGYQALNGETFNSAAFHGNAAFGYQALKSVTGFADNTGIGYQAGYNIMSGAGNTAIGYGSMPTNTTGSFNTVLGYQSDITTSSTASATALGYNSKAASTGIAIGANATAVSNQCTLNGVRSLNMPSIQSSGVGYVLTDSTGLGNFTSQALPAVYSSAAFDSAQTSAQTITSFSPSKNGTYSASVTLMVATITTDSIAVAVSFVDEGGVSRTLFYYPQGATNYKIGSTGYYSLPPIVFRSSASSISVATTLPTSGGSIKYDAGASIKWLGY